MILNKYIPTFVDTTRTLPMSLAFGLCFPLNMWGHGVFGLPGIVQVLLMAMSV